MDIAALQDRAVVITMMMLVTAQLVMIMMLVAAQLAAGIGSRLAAAQPTEEAPCPNPCWSGCCPVPRWEPVWQLNRSTAVQPCNRSGWMGALPGGGSIGEYGLVSYDWSNNRAGGCSRRGARACCHLLPSLTAAATTARP